MNLTLQKISLIPKSIEKALYIKGKNGISKEMPANCIELTPECLEQISGGNIQSAVRTVGKIIAFPFRSVSYGVGALIASIPKGFVDGLYDSWTCWEEYEKQEN